MTKEFENILIGKKLESEKRSRTQEYNFLKIEHKKINEYLENNWELEKVLKITTKIKKLKSYNELFINKSWKLFFNLGFEQMNGRQVLVGDVTIDIIAADDETVLFVFCESSKEAQKRQSLLTSLVKIIENKLNLINYAREQFPGTKKKYSYIFMTNNYILPDQDLVFMKQKNIIYFNEESIKYYEELSGHLGRAARFQLLGYLFTGQKIPGMDNRIPAIEGKMGGHKYYSFSIEPEKLLKIGYVLHRNNANKQMMPTYQRIIKKSRLNSIQDFVDEGGFFPNSLIINIEKEDLNFDRSDKQVLDAISRIGVLHLPQSYRSAYIIDGQHRLYGYANSEYASKNSIPVVAFVNLDRKEQIKLFMDINENQKAVSKNLRTTLNADLLWESENFFERKTALKSQISQSLGEDLDSPLYQRIIVGENPKTDYCSITLESVKKALDDSDFLEKYDKKSNKLLEIGTLDIGNNDETSLILLRFLKEYFIYIEKGLESEWKESNKTNSFIVINSGIYSLIRILNDIVNYLVKRENFDFKEMNKEEVKNEISPYLDSIIEFYKSTSKDELILIKKSYGAGGRIKYWRTLQRAINKNYPEFCPEGMKEYWQNNDMRFNNDSYDMIRDIETYINKDFKEKLINYYGDDWFKSGLPRKVYDEAMQLAASKNYDKLKEDEVSPWTCLNTIHYREIAVKKENWLHIFSNAYTMPGEEKISGGKDAKTKWIEKFSRIRNENHHTYSITEKEFEFLEKIRTWLIRV
ncbi:DGQHR domain-containing protein [Carnobacterium gallinarum]|uniref:DGQHR domain-containing protein n=1 Tax=Carnobacterium gallinarum TaxID=2749 RepID=UPI00055620F6|nr:DGQHR domain-containing protein [Carnobacterium gallinarum]